MLMPSMEGRMRAFAGLFSGYWLTLAYMHRTAWKWVRIRGNRSACLGELKSKSTRVCLSSTKAYIIPTCKIIRIIVIRERLNDSIVTGIDTNFTCPKVA